jgi:hypothetical protein
MKKCRIMQHRYNNLLSATAWKIPAVYAGRKLTAVQILIKIQSIKALYLPFQRNCLKK